MEINHPCKLTRTAVKVTFPGMKKEVLVSFIGYKEPNLMFVNRCKGLCSSDAIGHVACVPTKRSWKKVNMQLKTQVLGHENVKEKFKELVLEEHEECACQCLTVTPAHCLRPSLFNNETCSCACDTSVYHRDRLQCEAYPGRVWDQRTCSCARADDVLNQLPPPPPSVVGGPSGSQDRASDKQTPKFVNYPGDGGGFGGNSEEGGSQFGDFGDSGGGGGPMLYDPPVPHHGCAECLNCLTLVGGVEGLRGPDDYVTRYSWRIVGSCAALIVALLATTAFFWRKSRILAEELEGGSAGSEEDGGSSSGSRAPGHSSPQHQQQKPQHLLNSLKVAISPDERKRGNGGVDSYKQNAMSKANSLSELEARELLLSNNSKGLTEAGGKNRDHNGDGRGGGGSSRLTNSLGRHTHKNTEGSKSSKHHQSSTSPSKSSPGKAAATSPTRLALTFEQQSLVPSPLSPPVAENSHLQQHHYTHLHVPQPAPPPAQSPQPPPTPQQHQSSGKRSSSSGARKRHGRAQKKREKQRQQQQQQQYVVDTGILNDSELVQNCYFEDDLDPNFVNHQKIGAADEL